MLCVISYQKKKLRKPKESASPPSESFNMHFSLRGMGRGGERGGDQFKWCQIRGAPEHPVPHFKIRGGGSSMMVCSGPEKKTGEAKRDVEECNIWDTSSFPE